MKIGLWILTILLLGISAYGLGSNLDRISVGFGENVWTINDDGRGDVVQHAHPDSTTIHFHETELTTGVYRFILVDIDNIGDNDTTYKHDFTNYAHIEWVQLQIDASETPSAAYDVSYGFLKNVTSTGADRYWVKHFSGTKQTGVQLNVFEDFYPNGWRMSNEFITTHARSYNVSVWNSTASYGDSINVSGGVNPGNGDIVLEINVTAGTINIVFDMAYHSHS
jgi:hypothetical protein